MRQETINIYQYHELTEEAQQYAIEKWRDVGEYFWMDEGMASIKAFCNHYGVSLKDWSLSPYAYSYITTDADGHHFRGITLKQVEREKDLMPTGYCVDCTLFLTMYEAMKENGGNALEAFRTAIEAGKNDLISDMEYQDSNVYIAEHIEANGFEFLENGAIA